MDIKNMLLCKAKRLDNSKWVTGWASGFSADKDALEIVPTDNSKEGAVPIDNKTLCLNTMAKDSNNQWLFTGDIIKSGAFKGLIHTATDTNGVWSFFITWYQNGRATSRQPLFDVGYQSEAKWLYIGNIHDNKEILLKRES